MSGDQALDVLSQIQGCTYEREDLDQRRLGLIANQVGEAIEQLGIDNVTSSRWHAGANTKRSITTVWYLYSFRQLTL